MKSQYVPLLPYYDDLEEGISQSVSVHHCLSLFHIRQLRLLLTEMGLEDHPPVWRRISQHLNPADNSTNFLIDSGLPTERKLLNTRLTVRDVPHAGITTLMYCVAIGYSIFPDVPLVDLRECMEEGMPV